MKRKIITLLAGLLSTALFMPSAARACDGACGGGNNTNTRHHGMANALHTGTGDGLNNGVNLSLDQSQQNHNQFHGGKNGDDHKWHNHPAS
jgi:hypothetical protein